MPPTVATVVGVRDVDVVAAVGEDRATYLDAVLTQRLRDTPPGTVTSALELGPHGEPLGVLDLVVEEDRILLLVPTGQPEDVVGRLAARTFLSEVSFAPVADTTVLRLRGTDAHAVAAAAGAPTTPGRAVDHLGATWLGFHHGVDVVVDAAARPAVEAALHAAGAQDGDAATLDAAEVAAGVPRAPEEIARGRLPEELGLLPTHVHLAKGCYPGQEAVARMWMLGRPRRRLARVTLPDGVDVGEHGDGRARAVVTRVATTAGRRVGLAFVGADLTVGDEAAEGIVVTGFVGDDLPVPGHDPAVTRRRDRAATA